MLGRLLVEHVDADAFFTPSTLPSGPPDAAAGAAKLRQVHTSQGAERKVQAREWRGERRVVLCGERWDSACRVVWRERFGGERELMPVMFDLVPGGSRALHNTATNVMLLSCVSLLQKQLVSCIKGTRLGGMYCPTDAPLPFPGLAQGCLRLPALWSFPHIAHTFTHLPTPCAPQVQGSVQFNGANMDEFHVQRTVAYCDQYDNHNGYLTVVETLLFAFCCQVGARQPLGAEEAH